VPKKAINEEIRAHNYKKKQIMRPVRQKQRQALSKEVKKQ